MLIGRAVGRWFHLCVIYVSAFTDRNTSSIPSGPRLASNKRLRCHDRSLQERDRVFLPLFGRNAPSPSASHRGRPRARKSWAAPGDGAAEHSLATPLQGKREAKAHV